MVFMQTEMHSLNWWKKQDMVGHLGLPHINHGTKCEHYACVHALRCVCAWKSLELFCICVCTYAAQEKYQPECGSHITYFNIYHNL